MSKVVLNDVISGFGLSKINENFQKIQDELNNKVLYRNNPDGETNTLEQDVDVNGFNLYNVEKINGMFVDSLSESAQIIADNADLINEFAPHLDEIQDIAENFNAELALRIPEVGSYTALRAYTGVVTAVYVKGVSNIFDGGHGVFRVDTSDTTSSDNGGTIIVDSSGRRWKREPGSTVNVKWFNVNGDASDETVKLQNAFNAAEGKTLFLEAGKNYSFATLTIKAGTTVVSNGATFRRLSASTSHGFTIRGGVTIDSLVITTPGGTGGDKAVSLCGNNINIGFLSITAVSQGNSSSINWAVEIESSTPGTALYGISIGQFYSKYFSTAFFIKNAYLVRIDNAIVEYYRLAFYLKDVSRSAFKNITCRYLGAASNGIPGENGMLLESSIGSGSSHDILFENWYVSNSGEHAYRLGGQKSIYNVRFENCVAEKPGSSILNGDISGGEWHGGCGFKVLGGNTTITEFHENIYFDNCGVIDCNTTYGTYPAGHGVNNFTPWLIVMAKNVHLSNCWTKAVSQSYVARNGILFTAVDGLHMNSLSIRGADLTAIKPYQETPIVGYPGSDLPIKNLTIDGGFYEVTTATAGNGICFYMEEASNYANENWVIKSAVFKGGAQALRINTVGSGSYTNLNFDFTYIGSNVDDSSYTSSAITGSGAVGAIVNVVAPWRSAASGPAVANGSFWMSPNDGEVRTRTDDVWRRGPKTYKVVIADDSFATITPPAADVGFIAVSGSGSATHIFGWYRATSSPASSKYSGAATAVMVNTTLNGTTGADGNITIGVQNNLIYIENRNGSSNTFTVSFF